MRVHEIMTTDVATCGAHADVGAAAARMRERDCGFLPVVDAHGKVTGVVTDRDIALAVARTRRTAARTAVDEITSGHVSGVAPSDDVRAALALMRDRQVRRLPVIDAAGMLKGVVSMNDIVLHAGGADGPTASDVVESLKGICAHRHVEAVPA